MVRLARAVMTALALVLAVAAGTVCVAPAANAALPNLRDTYGPGIDPYPAYEGQTTCANAVQPGTLDLAAMLKSAFPTTNPWTYIRACTSGGVSEHKDGRAIDWMLDSTNPAQAAIADQFIAWLTASDKYGNPHAMARRLGVMYIIWKGQMLPLYKYSTFQWKANTGHYDHIHISLSWSGARRETSYWSKYFSMCAADSLNCPVTRLAGPDRYSTAVAVGRASAPAATSVVIASGEQAALVDGLSAGPLAATLSAPLLLTANAGLPAVVSADLSARRATKAYLVGGPSVVSDNVAAQLGELDIAVERLAGPTRYETATAVAAKIRALRGSALRHVVVASGESGHLIDALGGAALASMDSGAVLLTRGAALPPAVTAAVGTLGAERATIVGGESVVSPAVESQVAGLGVSVTRAAGSDRYATAAAAASLAYGLGGADRTALAVASGLDANMVDAIPASAMGVPVLLATPTTFPAASSTWVSQRDELEQVSVVGGPGALSNSTLDQVYYALVN